MISEQATLSWDQLKRNYPAQIMIGMAAGAGIAIGLIITGIANPAILLLAVVAIPALFLTVSRPEYGLALLVFLSYSRLSDAMKHFNGLPSIAQPFMVLMVGLILGRWVLYNERPRRMGKALTLFALYGVFSFSSLVYADYFGPAQTAFVTFIKDIIIALIIVALLQRTHNLRQVVWALLAAGLLMGTISVYQYLTGTYTNPYWGFGQAALQNISQGVEDFRIAGSVGDPNFYAQIMLVLVPIALDRVWNEKTPLLRAIAGYTLIVCLLTIVFTFSRGAIIGMAVVGVLILIRRPPSLIAIVLTAALLIPTLTYVPDTYFDRVASLTEIIPGVGTQQNARNEVSFRGRVSELLVGLMMFRDHPIVGVGLHNYPENYQQYSRQLGLDPRIEDRQAHSLYIEIMAEQGIVGILIYAYLFWTVLRGLNKAQRKLAQIGLQRESDMVNALLIGYVGFMTTSIFLHAAYPRFFWVLTGIALATLNVMKNERALLRLKTQREKEKQAVDTLGQQEVAYV